MAKLTATINVEGIPQLDRDVGKRARDNRARRLREIDYETLGALQPRSIVADVIEKRVAELRAAYQTELQRLLLLVHRPGLRRVYAEKDQREYIIDGAGNKLASIWVQWPDPGEFIVVIRSEVYTLSGMEAFGNGVDGSA